MVKNLKKLRLQKGISQQKLGEILGISQQAINKYENHNSEPDIKMLIAIAEYFNTTIDYLVGKEDKSDHNLCGLSEKEAEIIELYRKFNHKQQIAFDSFLDTFFNTNIDKK